MEGGVPSFRGSRYAPRGYGGDRFVFDFIIVASRRPRNLLIVSEAQSGDPKKFLVLCPSAPAT
jgi:hypothetical protein